MPKGRIPITRSVRDMFAGIPVYERLTAFAASKGLYTRKNLRYCTINMRDKSMKTIFLCYIIGVTNHGFKWPNESGILEK